MKIRKVGQIFRLFLTGVPFVQRIRRLRQSGDTNMIWCHLWQTCTRMCHLHTARPCQVSSRYLRSSIHWLTSKILRKTLSGSILIIIVYQWCWPVPQKVRTRCSHHREQEDVPNLRGRAFGAYILLLLMVTLNNVQNNIRVMWGAAKSKVASEGEWTTANWRIRVNTQSIGWSLWQALVLYTPRRADW